MGAIAQGHPGTWTGATHVDCAGDPNDGQVCVPGGAYWMGNPDVTYGSGADARADIQRLVVMAPFFLDAHEVTVGEYKSARIGIQGVAQKTNNGSLADWCTYGDSDALPLNCVSFVAAQRYCATRGGDLPTEAQFEFAASKLRGARFVWGDDQPSCSDARYARAGLGVTAGNADECWDERDRGGPLDPLRDRTDRDQLELAGGTIFDLAGDLSEWTRDAWEPQDGDCWGTGLFTSPVCNPDETGGMGTIRGGSWIDSAVTLHASWRADYERVKEFNFAGFRCARPGGP
jgi:formylglycine-generating enzyme required for sulfatase activity